MDGGNVSWQGGYEYNLVIALLAILLVVNGSGMIGIDRLFRRKKSVDEDVSNDTATPSGSTSRSSL